MEKARVIVSLTKISTILLPEVNGRCPLCGKYPLSQEKNGRILKNYEVAHIYPHSPTKEQLKVLQGVPRADDIESLDNVILLCKDCHSKQDFHTTVEDYTNLFNIKKRLQNNAISREKLSNNNIDESILNIIYSLKNLKKADLKPLDLKMEPLKISQKVKDDFLLLDAIKDKVLRYYRFIQEQFQILEGYSSNNFETVASQIRTAYLKANSSGISQEEVFNQLVSWLENINSETSSNIACQIIIAFFVQDCEVFDEISK